jgi:hypothetical protein
MLKKEAEKFVGKNVSCWTGLNGCYVGELVEVYGSPWRGKVKILEITSYPVQGMSQFKAGFCYRKPFAYGEIRDFGNSSITLYDKPIRDYKESLIETLAKDIKAMERGIENSKQLNRDVGLEIKWLEEMKRVLNETVNA